MSMKNQPIAPLPERTRQIAKASFPKGNFYLALHDQLGPLFEDELFSELYHDLGRPACEPWRLALITIFQFAEGLTDRQAADAVRARLDWKYLLHLEIDDAGFDFSVLSQFRTRLQEHDKTVLLFEHVLASLKEHKMLRANGPQRSDSTHILAAIRTLNRAECAGETMRVALNTVAAVIPRWVEQYAPADWLVRYGHPMSEFRMPKDEKQREKWLLQVGLDGHLLMDWIFSESTEPWLRQLPAIETLREVWIQNYYYENQGLRWRTNSQLPPSHLQIRSPHDTEARRGVKRTMDWLGYKVHVTETCDPELPKLITHVETTNANQTDIEQIEKIHANLAANDFHPEEHFVDAGYISARSIVESQEQYGIELVGPMLQETSWQSRVEGGVTASQFRLDWEKKEAVCPQGKKSKRWENAKTRQGKDIIKVRFHREDCLNCPLRGSCTKGEKNGRTLTLRPHEEHEAIEKRRAEQKSEDFKEKYNKRAGVEGVHSQSCNAMEMRRTRYIGQKKTHFQNVTTIAALNLRRALQWLQEAFSPAPSTPAFTELAA